MGRLTLLERDAEPSRTEGVASPFLTAALFYRMPQIQGPFGLVMVAARRGEYLESAIPCRVEEKT